LIFEEDFRLAIEELIQEDFGYLAVQSISPEEVLLRMTGGDKLKIIDVRTPGEYQMGHIPGVVLLPLETLARDAPGEIKKDDEIIVYCQAGVRSRRAARMLTLMGYRNVLDMGGILDWTKVGGPVVTD
jgi:rhodanese-related sulfurtransferase